MSSQVINGSGTPKADLSFAQSVRKASGQKFDRCYQCFTCSLGCPVASDMDYHPAQVIRMTQLGLREQVLTSSAIWTCLGCETCVTRCPNEVDIPRVMDALREIAITTGVRGKEKSIPAFHQSFLYPIKIFGKQYELGMLLLAKWKTKDLFSDLGLGMKMLIKGKIAIIPTSIKGTKQMKVIFAKKSRTPEGRRA